MFDYLNALNKAQKEAVTTIDGPVLIIAGAGSGKTTTLINRVAYMIDNNIDPSCILLLTFTNEAARNMIDKASKNANEKCKLITACTYHSFCVTLLRHYGHFIHIKSDFIILSQTDAEDVIKIIRSENPLYLQKGFPTNAMTVAIFSRAINTGVKTVYQLKEMLENYFPKYSIYYNLLATLLKNYTEYKKEHNLLDYDDLLFRTSHLLENQIALEKIQNTYKYIMVDEYQDTNYLQEKIVLSLSSKYHNIAVVGDDYQSIYAFRGSNIHNIIQFPNYFDNCKKIILNTNYRSTKEIVDVANNIMEHYAHFGYQKQMKALETGKKTNIIYTDTDQEEAKYIYENIQKAQKKSLPLSKIAVIARTSNEMALLESYLNKYNISYVKKGGTKFFDLAVIRDMLSYFKLLVNYYNEISWSRILDIIPGIGITHSSYLAKNCTQPNFLIDNNKKKCSFYSYLVELHELYQDVLTNHYSVEQLFCIFKNYYLELRELSISKLKTSNEDRREEMKQALEKDKKHIDTLWEIIKNYSSIQELLDDLILDPNKNEGNTDDQLTLTTIHSAKGLEWDLVYVLNCVNHYLPSVTENEDKQIFDEELRCFYVAITRAKKKLYLLVPNYLFIQGKHLGGLSHICNHLNNLVNEKRYLIEN